MPGVEIYCPESWRQLWKTGETNKENEKPLALERKMVANTRPLAVTVLSVGIIATANSGPLSKQFITCYPACLCFY